MILSNMVYESWLYVILVMLWISNSKPKMHIEKKYFGRDQDRLLTTDIVIGLEGLS